MTRDGASAWRARQRVTVALLAIWFVATFGVAYFGRDLAGVVFGWPFSFWMAAQGAPCVYLVLVAVYAWAMRRIDLGDAQTSVDGQGPDV
jgi:putative solute:sodium symporter small subunit